MADDGKPPQSELSSSKMVVDRAHPSTQPHEAGKVTGPFQPVDLDACDLVDVVQARDHEAETTAPNEVRSATIPDGVVQARPDTLTGSLFSGGREARDQSWKERWADTSLHLTEPLDPDLVLDQFHRLWRIPMIGYADFYTKKCADAADLVDDAQLILINKARVNPQILAPLARLPAFFRTLIRGQHRNNTRNHLNQQVLLERFRDSLGPSDTQAQDHAMRFTIHAALSQLSDFDKLLLRMRHLDQCTFEEIAKAVHMPETSIRRKIKLAENTVIRYTTEGDE